jgi:hypothetical protein
MNCVFNISGLEIIPLTWIRQVPYYVGIFLGCYHETGETGLAVTASEYNRVELYILFIHYSDRNWVHI